jgi:hypothetical protein
MKKPTQKLTFGLALLLSASATAQNQPAASSPSTPAPATTPTPPAPGATAPAPETWEQWAKQVKNPTEWMTWGADLRLRNEYFDNAITLDERAPRHEQDYFRFRERLWASVMPMKDLSVNGRLAAEQRLWMKPSFNGNYGARSGFEERYMILDNANVKWNNILDAPLSLTAGRQDIMFGDPLNWWLVADGTPGDGSWTFFLDSIRMGYEAKEIKTKFDLVYIYQNALPDEWIPTLGKSSESTAPGIGATPGGQRAYNLTEQNEQGVIVYLSNKSAKDMQVDGYFIYKRDNRVHTSLIPNGDNAQIYTLGGKLSGTPMEHLFYSAEGAYQFGTKQDPTVGAAYVDSTGYRDINAFGVNAKLTYLCKDKLNGQASAIFEYLSGDDKGSRGTDEMFDVLWGRWPRWSELYIYSYINENGGKIAQLNNIERIGGSYSLSPMKGMTCSATYNALFAPESTPTRQRAAAAAEFSNSGHFRGHYLQTVLKHQFNKNISGHVWGEFLWERDFYTQHDLMTFFRVELMFTF